MAKLAKEVEEVEYEDVEVVPGVTMQKRVPAHPHAPRPRPYVFSKAQIEEIAIGVKIAANLALTGPTGCGKTSVIAALAGLLGRPLIRFNCDGETRVSNLRGMMKPAAKDGILTLVFSAGDLAYAMQHGYWVLFDEIDAALPSVLFVLQPVLEEGRRTLHLPETGKTIEAHPDFRIFATGNTIGYRATARASHAGTHMMNSAFLDRFGLVIDCAYPPRLEEIERVKCNVPDIEDVFIDGVCRVAEELRQDTKFHSDFSTRRCVQWSRLIGEFEGDVLRASELAVVRKLDNPIDAKVAREVIRRIFGYPMEDVPAEAPKSARRERR